MLPRMILCLVLTQVSCFICLTTLCHVMSYITELPVVHDGRRNRGGRLKFPFCDYYLYMNVKR